MTSHQQSASFMASAYATGTNAARSATPSTAALLAPRSPWRLPVAAGVLAYQGLAGAALAAWLLMGQRAGLMETAIICAIPLVLTAWLALKADPDDRQFVAKLFAAAMFGPVLLAFWAGDQQSPVGAAAWPYMLAAVVAHLAALVGAVAGLGSYVTRVAPVAGVAPVDPRMLRERLLSLPGQEVAVDAEAGESKQGDSTKLVFHIRLPNPAHSHRVTLLLDNTLGRVRVLELIKSRGGRPANESEASMRGPGDAAFDPSRPDAQVISGTTWQTTMIEPQRLAGIRLAMDGAQVQLALPQARALDPEGVVTLMCAVVTRSGWTWQPGWKE